MGPDYYEQLVSTMLGGRLDTLYNYGIPKSRVS